MPVDHVALQPFLKHNNVTRWTLDVDFELRVDAFPMVLHVALPLESFPAVVIWTHKILLSLVNSFDVILEIVG